MELIMAIALLCQVSTGLSSFAAHERIDNYQLRCQKWYVECMEKKQNLALSTCIKERAKEKGL